MDGWLDSLLRIFALRIQSLFHAMSCDVSIWSRPSSQCRPGFPLKAMCDDGEGDGDGQHHPQAKPQPEAPSPKPLQKFTCLLAQVMNCMFEGSGLL